MPAKPLTPEQRQDAARLRRLFDSHQTKLKEAGQPHSQLELADQLGFGQSALAQYLGGKIPLNQDVLLKFATLLSVSPDLISPSINASAVAAARRWLDAPSTRSESTATTGQTLTAQEPVGMYVVGTSALLEKLSPRAIQIARIYDAASEERKGRFEAAMTLVGLDLPPADGEKSGQRHSR